MLNCKTATHAGARARGSAQATKRAHPLMLDRKSWDKPAVMDFLCDAIMESNRGVRAILDVGFPIRGRKAAPLPGYATFMRWLDSDPHLAAQYVTAKDWQREFLCDEIMEIADNAASDSVERARLRIDARKWHIERLGLKKYGVQKSVADPVEDLNKLTDAQIESRLKNYDKKQAMRAAG
jgi:hypothetical protein